MPLTYKSTRVDKMKCETRIDELKAKFEKDAQMQVAQMELYRKAALTQWAAVCLC
jgi:hypothetical protein